MKTESLAIYQKANSYKPPLPGVIMRIVNALGGIVSAYGSGWFFYWIFTIDAEIRYDFDLVNPSWWMGMVIGLLISMDIYIAKFKYGAKLAEFKLFGKEDVENTNSIVDSLKSLIGPLRIAARYTTVIGFAALLFGKIDYMFQQDDIVFSEIEMKMQELKHIESSPMPEFEKTATYQNLASLFYDGVNNDDSVRVEISRQQQTYDQRRSEQEQKAETLRAEITMLRKDNKKINNTALFDFFGKLWNIQSVLLIIISTIIAGVVVDQVFGVSSQEIGELSTYQSVALAFNPVNPVNYGGVNSAVNPSSTVNGSTKSGGNAEVGNSYGINFSNMKNIAILNAIKEHYHRIKPDGKRVSFEDIGNLPNINCKRQYVHKVKDAAIEEGLLPVDFMKQFEEAS